jgi:hypothetical protein
VTKTGTMKFGGGIELRFTWHEDESTTIERVIGPLTMPRVADHARPGDLLHERFRIVGTSAEDKERGRF